jgi:hypothetical protein
MNRDDIPEARRPAFDAAISAAGRILAMATERMNSMTPEEIAEAAWHPGGLSKEVLVTLAAERLGKRTQYVPASVL